MAEHKNEMREAHQNEMMEQRTPRVAVYIPRADVIETKDSFLVLADMPGVDEGSVDIQVERNILTLHGQIMPPPPEDARVVYQEFEAGRYERQFILSNEVDTTGIEAGMRQGVLEIRLPKAEQAKPRKITVTTS